jgi:hypothetical protein
MVSYCRCVYILISEQGFLGIKPEIFSHEEAAPICGALAAWNFLYENAKIKSVIKYSLMELQVLSEQLLYRLPIILKQKSQGYVVW